MIYNARRLITEAFNLSGIVSRDYETIDAPQIALGQTLLNNLLVLQSIDTSEIPYYEKYTFTTVVGQEMYFVENLVDIQSMCFFLGNVRIPMAQESRKGYFYTGRVENLSVMPFSFRMERTTGGANIWQYPLSSQPYVVEAMVKYGFTDITSLDQNLSTIYDEWYIVYLKYGLALEILYHYNKPIPPQLLQRFEKIKLDITETSPPDMRCTSISTYGDCGSSDIVSAVVGAWIGNGWVP